MQKTVVSILSAILLVLMLPFTAFAADDSTAFEFSLTADGKDTKEVKNGDIITVVLTLKRTDLDEAYTMYAMQDEISYDSDFFELVEGSVMLKDGVQSTDISMLDEYREFYMNFLSRSGGEQWEPGTVIGSFQLRVTGNSGVTYITSQDHRVSVKDGSDSYVSEAKDLTVILSSECTVRFVSNGGSEVGDATVNYGELLGRPGDPGRSGYTFAGWYTDIGLTQEWDFAKDKVTGNMTLYAKWAENTQDDNDGAAPDDTSNETQPEKSPNTGDGVIWMIPLVLLISGIVLLAVFFHKMKVKSAGGTDGETGRKN